MITLGTDGNNGRNVQFGMFKNRIELFDFKPGTKRLVIPEGWNKIRVAVIGAGGSGSSATNLFGTGGGGGGGYAERIMSVRPGEVYMYNVGGGGVNQPGGTTSFGNILSATGGDKASVGTDGVSSKGGVGGAGTGGTTNSLGGNGGNGKLAISGNRTGGGGGGSSGHRYGNGGPGQDSQGILVEAGNSPLPGNGGSWENNSNNILLYDDGWGLGITRFTPPLASALGVESAAGSYITWAFTEVGVGVVSNQQIPNYGAGNRGYDGRAQYGLFGSGLGGGGGGISISVTSTTVRSVAGGNGAVIIEVLE